MPTVAVVLTSVPGVAGRAKQSISAAGEPGFRAIGVIVGVPVAATAESCLISNMRVVAALTVFICTSTFKILTFIIAEFLWERVAICVEPAAPKVFERLQGLAVSLNEA